MKCQFITKVFEQILTPMREVFAQNKQGRVLHSQENLEEMSLYASPLLIVLDGLILSLFASILEFELRPELCPPGWS